MFKIAQTLQLTRLLDRFEGRIFSAYEVGFWKPHPGLFEHAAKSLGADPQRCLVIEDSLAGMEAARAAGMRAFGYAGDDDVLANELREAGARVFRNMALLPSLLDELSRR
jgi:beta-phosphoglucomutase-like phosphatase (HAD superfamily)